jgi:hypothetical protein
MPKGYCTASRQFWKAIGKRLENAEISDITAGQMLILAGCDENSGNWGCRPIGNKAQSCPAAIGKKQLLSLFSVALRFFIFIKSRRSSSKLCKPSVVLLLFLFFPTITLLAQLTLVPAAVPGTVAPVCNSLSSVCKYACSIYLWYIYQIAFCLANGGILILLVHIVRHRKWDKVESNLPCHF